MVSLALALCHCPHFRHTLGEWRTPHNLHALVPSLAYKPESAEVSWVWVWIPVPAILILWQEQFIWLCFSCFVLPKMGAKVALHRVTVRLLENMRTECLSKWCPLFVVNGYCGLRLRAGCWEWWRQALEAGLLPVSGAQAARQWARGAGWEDTREVRSMPRGDPHWQGLLASSQIGSFLLGSFHRPKISFHLGLFLENVFQMPNNMT